MTFLREATSKDRLKIDWLHPVPPAREEGRTSAAGPLPLADALAAVWETDQRPLLVLRECALCQGEDTALLSRSLRNDRTILLTKWFRVVRMPTNVTNPGHAFHNLFAGFAFGDTLPHFYLLAHPGAQPVHFNGSQTQSNLWKGIYEVLGQRYGRQPERAVREWLSLLDQYDRVDAALKATQNELDEARAKEGPDSDKCKNLQKRLREQKQERDELVAREERIRDLGLLSMPKAEHKPAAVVGAK